MVQLVDDIDGDFGKDWMLIQISIVDYMAGGREGHDYDGDQVLPCRSALELIRANLTDAERAALDTWDRTVRQQPKAFNEFFSLEHYREDPATALEEYVVDDDGKTQPVPRSHWWWRPLKETE